MNLNEPYFKNEGNVFDTYCVQDVCDRVILPLDDVICVITDHGDPFAVRGTVGKIYRRVAEVKIRKPHPIELILLGPHLLRLPNWPVAREKIINEYRRHNLDHKLGYVIWYDRKIASETLL